MNTDTDTDTSTRAAPKPWKPRIIAGIFPGEDSSALVVYLPAVRKIIFAEADLSNPVLLTFLRGNCRVVMGDAKGGLSATREIFDVLAIAADETAAPETARWAGRLEEGWTNQTGIAATLVRPGDVKVILGGRRRAGTAVVRASIIRRFAATGGGKIPEVGTRTEPGPLHGIRGHRLWGALGAAIAALELTAPDAATDRRFAHG